MGIFNNVKDKLGNINIGRKNQWDDDDYDDYDENYRDDYDDDYRDDYDDGDYDDDYEPSDDSGYDDSPSTTSPGVASWPQQLDGNARRESRLGEATPLVTNSDVRSKNYESSRRQPERNVSKPDYETSLSQYEITSRDTASRASNHSEESLSAAREELNALQKGVQVPLNSLNQDNRPANASNGARRDEFVPSTVSRRIVVIVPKSYNDAEKISEAFRNGSSAVVSFASIRPELAKRLLDFSFGVVSVSGGKVEKVGDKVFFLFRGGASLTETEKQQLHDSGIL